MTAGKLTELFLRAIAFTMVCGIIGYMLFVMTMWFIALYQVCVWIFVVLAKGWPGG